MPGRNDSLSSLSQFDTVEDAVLATDDDFSVLYANRAARRMFHLLPGAAIGVSLPEAIAVEDVSGLLDGLARGIVAGTPWRGEVVHTGLDGRRVRLDCVVTPLSPPAAGGPRLLLRLSPAEAAPADAPPAPETTSLYRDIVELAEDGICVVRDRRVRFANLQLARIVGWPLTDLTGAPIEDLIEPAELSRLLGLYAKSRSGDRNLGVVEAILRARDGRRVPVEVNGSQIEVEGTRANLFVIRDVTARQAAEDALRASEEKYRGLVENLNVGVYRNVAEGGGRFLHANPAMVRIVGYDDVEDFMRITAADLYQDPADRASVIADLRRAGFVRNRELRLKKKDGAPIWGSLSARAVRDDAGRVVWIDGIMEDVTERKRARLALQESEERFRTVVDASKDAIVAIDAEGRVTLFNPAAEQTFGRARDEVVGGPLDDLMPEETRTLHGGYVRGFFSTGKPDAAIGRTTELVGLRRDGARFPMDLSLSVGQRGGERFVVAVLRDVTERKRVEDRLRESEETARALLNAPAEMSVLVDTAGTILALNEYAARSIGRDASALIGRRGLDLLPAGLGPRVAELSVGVIRKGEPARFEEQQDGRWFDFSIYPVFGSEGKVTRLAASVRDITRHKMAEEDLRRALERAREADLLKSRFLANMSHEIRTPLNNVIGLATILLRMPDLAEEQRRDYFQLIQSGAESLLTMINAVLGLAKIESGTVRSKPVPLRPRELLAELCDHHRPQMDAKLLVLGCDVAPEIPDALVGDPVLLQQVLNNLLSNAFKFTRQGSVTIRVGVEYRADDDFVLRFGVRDTGIGIPADQLEKGFQPFFQVDGSSTREQPGTGLGLSIARESVRLLGGTM